MFWNIIILIPNSLEMEIFENQKNLFDFAKNSRDTAPLKMANEFYSILQYSLE